MPTANGTYSLPVNEGNTSRDAQASSNKRRKMTAGTLNNTKRVLQSYLSFEYLDMEPRPLVYVSRITNLSDARYCAGMGVDLLGFVIDPADPDYVSPETYQQLVGWLSGPERVAEVGSASFNEEQLREQYAPQYVHVASHRLSQWPVTDIKLIVEAPADALSSLRSQLEDRGDVAYVIVPGLEAQLPARVATSIPVLTGILPSQGHSLTHLARTGAAGIVLQGSRETAPGLKDYDHLSQVLEELNG
jgi:phosphoribosylanthranilate isomerase